MSRVMASSSNSKVVYVHTFFYPQPGDIILCEKPTIHIDGTLGPLVKIYTDNFYFAGYNSYRSSIPQVHIFQRGEKVLRLFKLYQNWEFVANKRSHKMFLYYPGFSKNRPWYLVNEAHSRQYCHEISPKYHFTHMLPSQIFTILPNDVFCPRLGDIIIHTLLQTTPITPGLKQCKKCKQDELRAFKNWRIPGLDEFSTTDDRDIYPLPHAIDFDPDEFCDECEDVEEVQKRPVPWKTRWEIEYWSEDFAPKLNDLIVRFEIDMQYNGAFKKTHLQVELFSYASQEKKWRYLGMDTAYFGPTIDERQIVYRPQPGDILISRHGHWCCDWDDTRKTGGYVLLHKDPGFFGDVDIGQDLWLFQSEIKLEGFNKTPSSSWLVRLGTFDEYWDFHLNDRAEVFMLHPNGTTMFRHHSTDYKHMAQPPNYEFDENPTILLDEVEVEPNHWDLIVRWVINAQQDSLISASGWMRDPEHWMRDPMLWGKDMPPRFDKEVEIYTYWSGFEFKANDLLVRAGFDRGNGMLYNTSGIKEETQEPEFGPRNPNLPPVKTGATVELYLVEDKGTPFKFTFLGRDKFFFPQENNVNNYNFNLFVEHVLDEKIPNRYYPPSNQDQAKAITEANLDENGQNKAMKTTDPTQAKQNNKQLSGEENGEGNDGAQEDEEFKKCKEEVIEHDLGEVDKKMENIREGKKRINNRDEDHTEFWKKARAEEVVSESIKSLNISGGENVALP